MSDHFDDHELPPDHEPEEGHELLEPDELLGEDHTELGEHFDHADLAPDDPDQPIHAVYESPGGTVFDALPGPEPEWLEPPSAEQWAAAIESGQYASVWAQDDGTGLIAALAVHDDEGAPAADGTSEVPVSDHLSELAYGDPHETAARLWEELLPGTPLPALDPRELLDELDRRLDDPVSRSVVQAARGGTIDH